MSACPLVVLACESLHVCTVCIWRCEHARFCVEGFYVLYINFYSFIHDTERWGWGGLFLLDKIADLLLILCLLSISLVIMMYCLCVCLCVCVCVLCHCIHVCVGFGWGWEMGGGGLLDMP